MIKRRGRRRRLTRDAFVAFHEAGHAVMGWIHKEWIRDGLEIHDYDEALASGGPLGTAGVNLNVWPSAVRALWTARLSRRHKRIHRGWLVWNIEMQILVGVAGYVAEHVAAERHGTTSDALETLELDMISSELDELAPLREDEHPSDCYQARSLAEALHGVAPLPAGVRSWLWDSLVPRAEGLLRRPLVWAAVERVARALLERRRLTGDDFEALMAEDPPERIPRAWEDEREDHLPRPVSRSNQHEERDERPTKAARGPRRRSRKK